MRFLHLADLHLGKTLGNFDLIEDQREILGQILRIAKEESVDGVLMAGDIYDKAIPSEAATALLDSFLSQLAKERIRAYMISGNHDSDGRLSYGSRLFAESRIFISSVFDGTLARHTLGTGEDEVSICLLPFVKASQVRHFYPDARIESYEDAVRAVLERAWVDKGKCNVLVAHQFVSGRGEDPILGGSEGVGARTVGTVEKIGYGCFDAFDYVALGHIHSPQEVGREGVRYAGSPLKYSLGEASNGKSVPIVDIRGKGKVSVRLCPLRARRDLRHVRGTMEELLSGGAAGPTDDFLYVTLTDEEMSGDAMGIFKKRYPNTVRIDYDNSRTREVERLDISHIAQNRSFGDLISDFYRQMYGREIDEEEMAVMRMAAREAGVIDEAD